MKRLAKGENEPPPDRGYGNDEASRSAIQVGCDSLAARSLKRKNRFHPFLRLYLCISSPEALRRRLVASFRPNLGKKVPRPEVVLSQPHPATWHGLSLQAEDRIHEVPVLCAAVRGTLAPWRVPLRAAPKEAACSQARQAQPVGGGGVGGSVASVRAADHRRYRPL